LIAAVEYIKSNKRDIEEIKDSRAIQAEYTPQLRLIYTLTRTLVKKDQVSTAPAGACRTILP
jgi:hypothetical protein